MMCIIGNNSNYLIINNKRKKSRSAFTATHTPLHALLDISFFNNDPIIYMYQKTKTNEMM